MEIDDELNLNPTLSTSSNNVMTMTIAPNQFLFSIYKENLRTSIDHPFESNQKSFAGPMHGHIRPQCNIFYKCSLCRKLSDDPILICSKCVNTGRFCSSRHDTCSSKRRQALVNMLNATDQEEFYQYSTKLSIHTPTHLQCSDRMFLLKKFNAEKKLLQTEFQNKMAPRMELNRLQDEIKLRKLRLQSIRQAIDRLKERNEQEQQANAKIQERREKRNYRIQNITKKIAEINQFLKSSKDELRKKNDLRIDYEQKLLTIRRQRLNEVYKYIFPIERISAIEKNLADTMRALSSAQQPIVDGNMNNDWSENDEALSVGRDRYQIVNSCLAADGDYQINKLLIAADVGGKTPEEDSVHSTVSYELYEVLSGLSHACQLINVIAFYLHTTLPFRLHQLEFTGETLTIDRLRADIAKLNGNIITACLAQGIHIDNAHVTRTLENLCKLLTHRQTSSRPKPVIYSSQYIELMEEEVNEISRAYVTDYWFDDVEKDVTDLLNSDEWETVPQNYSFPEDPSIHERLGPLPSLSGQQQQPQHLSVMSGSIGFLKNKGSNLISSVFRTLSKS